MTMAAALLSLAAAQGFRGIPWGSTQDYVAAHETLSYVGAQGNIVMYQGSVGGLDAAAAYEFLPSRDVFVRGSYIFTETHVNENLYIDDYNSVKAILTDKYGTPVDDRTVWSNDLFKDDPSSYGMAVAVGHLKYVTRWETPTETITIILGGDNYEVTMGAVYLSKEYEADYNAAQEQSKGDDF